MSDPDRVVRGAPVFQVHVGTSMLAEVGMDSSDVIATTPVSETQQVGFELWGVEPSTEYRIRLGSHDHTSQADVGSTGVVVAYARLFPRFAAWETAQYFESARGRTAVIVESRAAGTDGWRTRVTMQFVVVPTKLGERRYQRMFDELSGLATGLVLDLISKSRVALGFVSQPDMVHAGSSQLELRRLLAAWRRISEALEDIQRDPELAITRRPVARQCWGGERLSHRGIRRLAAAGADVRRAGAQRPFVTIVDMTEETTDTVEHRRIGAFLQLLEGRAHECALNAEAQIRRIDRDRLFRDTRIADGPSLYETEDVPRIRRLRAAADGAHALRSRVREAQQLPMLRGITAAPGPLRSPVFEHVPSYRRFRDAAVSFARSSVVVLGDGLEEHLKSTSRMYEQWVLLQLLSAFREAGFRASSGTRLIRAVGTHRYTLDIERGAHVEFRARDGRIVSIRYEPWILPKEEARARRETVYRGREGTAAWSPDILIEIMRDDAEQGVPNTVIYGVVVDAKYSRRIHDTQWEAARKYLEIKSTRTGRQVIFQSWLAYPGADEPIAFPDSDVEWGDGGPTLPSGDAALGKLPLVPDFVEDLTSSADVRPTERAREFVRGLLAYLEFEEAVSLSSDLVAAERA